jgi:hypothetical protein
MCSLRILEVILFGKTGLLYRNVCMYVYTHIYVYIYRVSRKYVW